MMPPHIDSAFHIGHLARHLLLLVSVIVNFAIYYRTKEVYELTEHRGIKYFRNGFLFLGIANLYMLFIRFILNEPFLGKGKTSIAFLIYVAPHFFLHILGLTNLLYSLIWKNFNKHHIKEKIILTIASLTVIIQFIIKTKFFFVGISLLLILSILTISIYQSYFDKKKKFSFIRSSYILLVLSLFISTIRFRYYVSEEFKIIHATIASILYITIYYKVHRELKEK